MFASTKMLTKIYLSFPQLWNIYSAKRKEKGIEIPETSQEYSMLNNSIISQKVSLLKHPG